jgi:uncharacterized protein YndB with AHSA1/START domain
MTETTHQPGAPANVHAERDGERWTLVFVRELRHAPAKVWSALTDPEQLRAWAPFDADRDLGRTGAAKLTMASARGKAAAAPPLQITVHRAEPEALLEYDWGGDRLRWELAATPTGTRLTLRHTVNDRGMLSKVAAGWHICIDVAERSLAGAPVARIVGEDALQHGWDGLHEAYGKKLDH